MALDRRDVRDEAGLFYVEGVRFVLAALAAGAAIETLVVSRDLLAGAPARLAAGRAQKRAGAVLEVTEDAFRRLSHAAEPQGIGAVVRQRWHGLRDIRPGRELCWLVVDTVNSPGNLGTMLRTSEAAGGAGLIVLGSRTDPYDPAVLRATMGAIFTQRLVRATPREFEAFRRERGFHLIGTSARATADYRELRYRPPVGVFMGCEQGGLGPDQLRACDQVVRIPMAGRCDSLNVAVATGIVLYEVFRKREEARQAAAGISGDGAPRSAGRPQKARAKQTVRS